MNGRKETDPNMIANGYNNYFANIGPTLASKICTNDVSHRDFILQGINASLFLEPTNDTEIKLIIGQLKEGAYGRDRIMPKHIKCVSESIAYPLTRMANLSFEQGVFPEELKLAIITPIYKAKDPVFFNNYRPISVLSLFSKISKSALCIIDCWDWSIDIISLTNTNLGFETGTQHLWPWSCY